MVDDGDPGHAAPSIVQMVAKDGGMTHPAIAQIEAYWEGLRGARVAPLRSEVDPRGIDRALEYAFILERIAPNVARFRLAGMHLNDLMGMEVRGMPITAFLTPDGRNRFRDTLEHVFEQPAKARIKLVGETGLGRPSLRGELLLLPLRSDLGDVSRALGCLVVEGRLGKAPHRFSIASSGIEPLMEGVPAPRRRSYPASDPAPQRSDALEEGGEPYGEATEAPPAEPAVSQSSGRPYLRLVHDSDKPS